MTPGSGPYRYDVISEVIHGPDGIRWNHRARFGPHPSKIVAGLNLAYAAGQAAERDRLAAVVEAARSTEAILAKMVALFDPQSHADYGSSVSSREARAAIDCLRIALAALDAGSQP